MKLVLKCLLIFSLSFLFLGKVYAFDEYLVDVSDNNTITVKNAIGNTNVDDYSNIVEFSNGVLTIKEGVHINRIHAHQNITLTSNNKKVYVNVLSFEDVEVVADRLNLETYDSAVQPYNNQYNTPEYTHFGCDKLTIKDSNIKMNSSKGMMDNEIHTNRYDLKIEDSTVYATVIDVFQNGANITINNSNVSAGFISSTGQNGIMNITISDSVLDFLAYDGDSFLQANTDLKVSDTIIKNCLLLYGGKSIILDNVQFIKGEVGEEAIMSQDITIKDSDLNVNYNITGGNLYLINTSLTVIGEEENYFILDGPNNQQIKMPVVSISGNIDLKSSSLEIDSSNVKAVNDVTLPPLAVMGTITSDDPNFVFIDDNKNVLKITEDNINNYGVPVLPNNSNTIFNTYTNKSGELVYKIRSTSAVKYNLKIENGTWEDGTSTDTEVYLFDGEVPNKDTIKSKSSIDGYVLSVIKTGDNEYTYKYVKLENPKTGVYVLSIGYVIFLAGILLFKKYLINFSLFKRI